MARVRRARGRRLDRLVGACAGRPVPPPHEVVQRAVGELAPGQVRAQRVRDPERLEEQRLAIAEADPPHHPGPAAGARARAQRGPRRPRAACAASRALAPTARCPAPASAPRTRPGAEACGRRAAARRTCPSPAGDRPCRGGPGARPPGGRSSVRGRAARRSPARMPAGRADAARRLRSPARAPPRPVGIGVRPGSDGHRPIYTTSRSTTGFPSMAGLQPVSLGRCRCTSSRGAMPPEPLPLVRAAGTHAEVGAQIGRAGAAAVGRVAAAVTPAELAGALPYHEVTARELPWLVEELDAVADAAGVEPDARVRGRRSRSSRASTGPRAAAPTWSPGRRRAPTGTCGWRTTTTSSPEVEPDVVATEWRIPGDPVVFTIGVGPWISVGFNSAGLALTGNEVSPNDNRVGIPRLLHVRDILRRRTLDEAVEAALHPAPRVLVQHHAQPPRRRRRERRGLGHRRRADPARAGRARWRTRTTT